jgi:hypothetical protein
VTQFFLGVHRPGWLAAAGVPLFVSHRVLAGRKTYPRAAAPWALDSGGFTELSLHGEWVTPPSVYVAAVRRYQDEIGLLQWASPQDWMNEPVMLAKTGLAVAEHQRRTVDNYLELRELSGGQLPFIPVLQGWEPDEYLRCVDLYAQAGVDLHAEPVVGVGTVCRRQDTAVANAIFASLNELGLTNLHGFGVKLTGLRRYGHHLTSSDSMAWSYRARRAGNQPPCPKANCANCLHFALEWRVGAVEACL